jgi:hypothetical protein
MTLQEFITQYNGKRNDFDNFYGAQCFDLFQFYNRDVIGGGFVPGNAAYDIVSTYPKNLYTYVQNTPSGVPEAGNVIIWGKGYGPYGHVAIITEANVNSFKCLSQNDPIGRETHIKEYPNYNGVLGWLKPIKQVTQQPTMNDQDKKDIESMKKLREYNGVWYEAKNIIDDFEKMKVDRKAEADALNAKIDKVSTDNLILLDDLEASKKHAALTLESELSKQRSEMLMTCASEKKTITEDYEEKLKNSQKDNPVEIVEKETALSIRFQHKPIKERIRAIVDILLA